MTSDTLGEDLSAALKSSKPRLNLSTDQTSVQQPPPPPPSPVGFPASNAAPWTSCG
jgi:hypothetical protein